MDTPGVRNWSNLARHFQSIATTKGQPEYHIGGALLVDGSVQIAFWLKDFSWETALSEVCQEASETSPRGTLLAFALPRPNTVCQIP
jgi:hypothetical protein